MLKFGYNTSRMCPPEEKNVPKKAAATGRHKNKGHTEGSTKQK